MAEPSLIRRFAVAFCLVLAAACRTATSSSGVGAAAPSARSPSIATTIEEVTDLTPSEAPRTRADSLRQRALERAARAAEQTDTIIATPAAIHLRVGDSVSWFGTLRFQGRDQAGAVVPGFGPLLRAGPASVVTLRGLYVIAVAPGQGTLFVQASRGRDMRPPEQRPLTLVPIDVSAR